VWLDVMCDKMGCTIDLYQISDIFHMKFAFPLTSFKNFAFHSWQLVKYY